MGVFILKLGKKIRGWKERWGRGRWFGFGGLGRGCWVVWVFCG